MCKLLEGSVRPNPTSPPLLKLIAELFVSPLCFKIKLEIEPELEGK